ncbi:MAG: hypothetical protein JSW34_05570 [Candidatus Zixiibacteriota bacterium]|nr:MAG: hypothetical protein JSW34_05570 [candidate division Zixibacteria bacterium]
MPLSLKIFLFGLTAVAWVWTAVWVRRTGVQWAVQRGHEHPRRMGYILLGAFKLATVATILALHDMGAF